MGFKDLIGKFMNPEPGGPLRSARMGLDELSRRLGIDLPTLTSVPVTYTSFIIPKRSGGTRVIQSPNPQLKSIQRQILRRLLARLRSHPAATGFERGRSIVSNAIPHAGKSLLIKMDIREFFSSTGARRIELYFNHIGWSDDAAVLLTRLCTFEGRLPQGAPTSPRLSNLVNFRLDARLSALARKLDGSYTRYADDLTFSFGEDDWEKRYATIRVTKLALENDGYHLHTRRKLHIRRRHQQQRVTGLVVNERVRLARKTRRWLRAVEHHVRTGKAVTLTGAQLDGWRSFAGMVLRQAEEQPRTD